MKEYLTNLSQILNEIDNNPMKSMQFITNATASTNIVNKSPDKCRMDLIVHILHNLIYHNSQITDELDIHKNIDEILYNINDKYQKNQHLCWQSHTHHFHKAFDEYVNCPVTCLFELSEFIDKLRRECYVQ